LETPNFEQSDTEHKTQNTQNSLKIDSFWQYNEPLESTLVVIAPSTSETILDVLGPIPLPELDVTGTSGSVSTSAAETVMQYLNGVYQQVSQQAVLAAMNIEA
jgi:uncharacterized Zn finger protein